MKIYTGNFANKKKYEAAGLHLISIAVSARYFLGDKYRVLNPKKEWMHEDEKSYTPKFKAILASLKAQDVYEDLRKIGGGRDIILLCHEGEQDFCHRHLVADWIEKELKIKVVELGKMKLPHQQIKNKSLFADLV